MSNRLAVVADSRVSFRRESNGVLLLDSAMQLPVRQDNETVAVDLPLLSATRILNGYRAMTSKDRKAAEAVSEANQKRFENLVEQLASRVEAATSRSESNQKRVKVSNSALHILLLSQHLKISRLSQSCFC